MNLHVSDDKVSEMFKDLLKREYGARMVEKNYKPDNLLAQEIVMAFDIKDAKETYDKIMGACEKSNKLKEQLKFTLKLLEEIS